MCRLEKITKKFPLRKGIYSPRYLPGFLHSHLFGLCFPLTLVNVVICSQVKKNMNLSKKNASEKPVCGISSSFGDLYQDVDPRSSAQSLGKGTLWQSVPS